MRAIRPGPNLDRPGFQPWLSASQVTLGLSLHLPTVGSCICSPSSGSQSGPPVCPLWRPVSAEARLPCRCPPFLGGNDLTRKARRGKSAQIGGWRKVFQAKGKTCAKAPSAEGMWIQISSLPLLTCCPCARIFFSLNLSFLTFRMGIVIPGCQATRRLRCMKVPCLALLP